MRQAMLLTALFLAACQFEPFEATPIRSQLEWQDHHACIIKVAQMSWLYNDCRSTYAIVQPENEKTFELKDLILCRFDNGHEIKMPESFCRAEGGTVSRG